MYVIKKKSAFSDTLRLEDEQGNKQEIKFTLSLKPEMIKEYRRLQLELIELQKQTQDKQDEQTVERFGKCIVSVFELLFGAENTQKILEFYENNYTEMIVDILPYIQTVIAPELKGAVKQIKKNTMNRFRK